MRPSSGAAAFAALLCALALAACGGSDSPAEDDTYDAADVEEALGAEQRLATSELTVGEVDCPDDVSVVPGATLRCTVVLEGVKAPYVVRVRRGEAGRPRLEFQNARPIIDTAKLVEFVRREVGASGRVDCGTAAIQIVRVGARLTCTVRGPGGPRRVNVVVKDRLGNVALERG